VTPHRIRLAGFWVESAAPHGGTCYTRSFGRPRTLDTGDEVWLVLGTRGEVRVNGVRMGLGGEFRLDAVLEPRSTAEIVLTAGVPLGEVAIEIRPG
jgi:hypothetical protein